MLRASWILLRILNPLAWLYNSVGYVVAVLSLRSHWLRSARLGCGSVSITPRRVPPGTPGFESGTPGLSHIPKLKNPDISPKGFTHCDSKNFQKKCKRVFVPVMCFLVPLLVFYLCVGFVFGGVLCWW